jgi:hypothetical protein
MEFVVEVLCWVVGTAVLFRVMRAVDNSRSSLPRPKTAARPLRQSEKRYVMRGYGGNPKTTTTLHPRLARAGYRLVNIPGVGFRHVKPNQKR